MLSAIIAFIGAIPGIGAAVQFIVGKVYDSKVAIATAKIGGDRDVAVQLVKTQAVAEHEAVNRISVFAGSKVLLAILVALISPFIVFEWKVVVWDIVLGWGTTDAIKGQVADWATTIIGCVCGTGGTLALGNMWFNRKAS